MITKYATLEASVLEVRSAPEKLESPSLGRYSSYNDYRTDDGYIYTRVRAISSRVNKNFDGWPSDQLAAAYRTFVGKPIFVDHNNSNPTRSRGVVVDAILHVEDDMAKASAFDPYYSNAPANHCPPTWIELLLETDARAYPKLAANIISGEIDSVSMGANVEKTKCSVCNHEAFSADDFCKHVQLKGAHFDHYDDMGKKSSKLAYEDCYDISFFEISYVFDPADDTALVHEVRHSSVRDDAFAKAAKKFADSQDPRFEKPLPDDEYFQMSDDELKDRALEIANDDPDESTRMAEALQARQRAFNRTVDLGTMQQELEGPHRDMIMDRARWEKGVAEHGTPIRDLQQKDVVIPEEKWHNTMPMSGPNAVQAPGNSPQQKFKDYLLQNAPQSEFNGVQNEWDPDADDDPFDPRRRAHLAKINRIIDSVFGPRKSDQHDTPQSMSLTAPDQVDTLRLEKGCDICGSEMDGGVCAVCGYEEPPTSFDNPDLDLAQQVRDLIENSQDNLAEGGQPQMPPMQDPMAGGGLPPTGAPMPPQAAAGMPPMQSSTNKAQTATNVTSEWNVTVRSKVASKINKNEIPILPTTRSTSDLAINPKVVKDSLKAVESNTKEINSMNWDTVVEELKARGHDPVKISALTTAGVIDRIVERVSADAEGGSDVKPDARVPVDGVGQVAGDPEAGVEHINVEKPLKEEVGDDTKTFGDNSTQAVTPGVGSAGIGPIGQPVSNTKKADKIPDHEPAHIDVEKPIGGEEIGEPTKTWGSDDFHITDPITKEVGSFGSPSAPIGQPVSNVKAHIFAAMKLAEDEVELGLVEPEEKFDRAAILEQQTPEQLQTHGETLAMVRKANLTSKTATRKPVSKVPAGISKSASTSGDIASKPFDSDSAIFM
jgi:hypothetical protein